MCYYIKTEEKNQNYLIISVIRNRRRHTGIDKEYTNEDPKQATELNDTELGFLKSLNDIIYEYPDEILPDYDKVSREIETKKKRNESDLEIIENDNEDIEEDENSDHDICSDYGEHTSFNNYELDLEETLPPQYQGDTSSIVDDLYNKLEVDKYDYELEGIVDHCFKGGILFLKAKYVGKTLG